MMSANITLQDVFNKLLSIEVTTDETKKSLEAFKIDLQQNKTKIEELEEENKRLKVKLSEAEQREKKNNIVVYGLSNQDSIEENVTQLQSLLGITLEKHDLNDVYFLGQNANRPMKIELNSSLKKREIIQNSYKLKGKQIYVNNDWTKEEFAINKFLRGFVKQAKENNSKAVIKKNRYILVNGKTFTYEYLKNNPEVKIFIKKTNNEEQGGNSEEDYVAVSDEEGRDIDKAPSSSKAATASPVNTKSPKKLKRRRVK